MASSQDERAALTREEAETIAAVYAERDRLRAEVARLWPLAWALEADEDHGNLTGRAEDAWYAYKEDCRGA